MKCVSCRVTGRVQGVWFRGSTQKQAQALGITGYARNMPDGSVAVLACGDEAAIDSLVEWLHRGPTLARVTGVEVEPVDTEPPASFTVD
jgi:acylphosphatase